MHRWETRMRLRHYLDQGVSKAELSRQFGVSRRTIHRWIRSGQLDLETSCVSLSLAMTDPVIPSLVGPGSSQRTVGVLASHGLAQSAGIRPEVGWQNSSARSRVSQSDVGIS